ncbi:MAG: YdcF family protein [Lachnospiraceae bacterium]|nr:YdcF family protein [Lachnospiraceae bacterium]
MKKKLITGILLLAACILLLYLLPEEKAAEEELPKEEAALPTLSPAKLSGLRKSAIQNFGAGKPMDSSLQALRDASPADAADMEELLLFWDKTNEKDFVRMDSLPEGLPADDSLCIVILGYALNSDGSMREELVHRLQTGLSASQKYPEAYVLVTGGGTASNNPAATEADAMADWLKKAGVDADRIIIENESQTTAENAVFSERILTKKYPQVTDVAIVTCDYHIPLGCQLFDARFIFSGSKARVKANAACDSEGSMPFSFDSQLKWMLNLLSYD